MKAKPKILVVEDDARVVIFVTDLLEYMGYEVRTARNGIDGLKSVREEIPDLIVLDVMMPELDGFEVCRQLKSDRRTSGIPVLMLTAKGQLRDMVKGLDIGADDYLAKPYDKAEFEARVKALLRRAVSPPYPATERDSSLSISFAPTQRLNIRVAGTTTLSAITRELLDIDGDAYSRQADNVPRLDWRFNSKQTGKHLHDKIFLSHQEVLGSYAQALGEIGEAEEDLHLRFESSRDLLRLPLEFLFGGAGLDGDYLVLRHPLARSITGVQTKRSALSPTFLNDIWSSGSSLKILLIASNTKPEIPGVDDEILALHDLIGRSFDAQGISVEIDVIPTDRASYQTVRQVLQKNQYHIVHYAGHGLYDPSSPEKSSLFFSEKENRQGTVKRMPISELKMLLNGSNVRLMYLSCCLGTKTGEMEKLLDDDFLGLADGIIHAGVPSVVGFRWPVSDSGAKRLAQSFYESLANQGRIDTALLHARQHSASLNRDDITWLSPVLIMQA